RILTAATLVALAVAPALRADDKPNDKAVKTPSRAEQFAKLQQDFQKALPEVINQWRTAKDDDERNKALAKIDPFLDRAYKLVEESPKDDVSLNALTLTMRMKPTTPDKTFDLLAEHHLANPIFFPTLLQFAQGPMPGAKKLIDAAEKSSV